MKIISSLVIIHRSNLIYFTYMYYLFPCNVVLLFCADDSSQEFGQSTPEIRKSNRKIPTLFKKRKLEREASSGNTSNKPVRYRAPSPVQGVNGTSYDDELSDNSAIGEYIEVKTDVDLLQCSVVCVIIACVVINFSGNFLKGATSRCFELLLGRLKMSLIGRKPLNNSLLWQSNTKETRINQHGTRMVEDEED